MKEEKNKKWNHIISLHVLHALFNSRTVVITYSGLCLKPRALFYFLSRLAKYYSKRYINTNEEEYVKIESIGI